MYIRFASLHFLHGMIVSVLCQNRAQYRKKKEYSVFLLGNDALYFTAFLFELGVFGSWVEVFHNFDSSMTRRVDGAGFEPAASTMPTWRSYQADLPAQRPKLLKL